MADTDPERTADENYLPSMKTVRNLATALSCLVLVFGCASYETYSDVKPEELNTSTLWSGLKLRLEYADGTQARFTVREVNDDSIVSTDGKEWPKTGIKTLTLKTPPNSADCGSLASWRNRQCWIDDAERAIDSVF